MKIFTAFSRFISAATALLLCTGCVTTTPATASKESLLTQAGFLLLPPQNPKQTKMFKSLPPGKISTLTSPSGKTLYVMPDATGSKAYVGKQTQYDKYRALRGSQSITDQESIIKTQEMEMNDFGSGILEGIQ